LGVIANASPAQIAEYLSKATASSQSGVNELQPALAVAAVPALDQGVLMDSESAAAQESTGHQSGRTACKRNMPSRYQAEAFHTQGDADSRRMDFALVADWETRLGCNRMSSPCARLCLIGPRKQSQL